MKMKTESTELKIDVSLNQEMLKGLVVSALKQKIDLLSKDETSQDASPYIQSAEIEIERIQDNLKHMVDSTNYGLLTDKGIKWGRHNVDEVRGKIHSYLTDISEIEDFCQEVLDALATLRDIRKTLANSDTQKLEDAISIFIDDEEN
jgi:Mg2+ and Co2+ transporter CorA